MLTASNRRELYIALWSLTLCDAHQSAFRKVNIRDISSSRPVLRGHGVNVNIAPFSSRNTALPHSARHDVVASKDNAQRRCALSGDETPCKRLSAIKSSMFLELSSQSAPSTASAPRCAPVMSRHDKSPAAHFAAPEH